MKENKNSEEPERRATPNARKTLVRTGGIAVIVVILIAAIAVVISGGKKGESAADADIRYEISAESVLDMQTLSGKIVILKQNSVLYLDEAGRYITELEHNYANPVMLCAGKFLLLYDKGGNDLRIELNTEVYRTVHTESPITCADLTGNGLFTYVLNSSEGYQSHLYAYTYKGVKKFEWGSSSDEFVLGTKLSSGGKHVLINVLRVSNASHVSVVYLFKFTDSTALCTAEFPDKTVYAGKLVRSDRAVLFTDRGVCYLDQKGETEELKPHAQNELNSLYIKETGVSALILNQYGNQNKPELTVFDNRFKNTQSAVFEGTIACACAAKSYAAVVCGETLYICPAKGKCRVIELGEKCFSVTASDKTVFVLLANGVRSYSANQGELTDLAPESP